MSSLPKEPLRRSKRRRSTLDDSSAAPPPPKRARHSIQVPPKDEVRSHRVAHPQTQSALIHTLPPEILDAILGDLVLNERDHIALSGTCTLIRLGYTEQVWQTMIPGPIPRNTVRESHFTLALLSDPCNLSQCFSVSPIPNTARSRIFSTALSYTSTTVTPGIDLRSICANLEHKKRKRECDCIRFVGPAHGKVVRRVNARLTAWGRIEYRYKSLSKLIDPAQVNLRSVLPIEDKNKREPKNHAQYRCYCLATVDAAIWNAAGGSSGVKSIWESQLEGKVRKKLSPPSGEDIGSDKVALFIWSSEVNIGKGRVSRITNLVPT
ncbi:hypothetical protein DL96DRAFT_1624317 [Flagelloscypha sp. PMI_526]|nr:hypothetical protein DL96DRAFT_1624317 [Flagelloscypha sp. PMI_526]